MSTSGRFPRSGSLWRFTRLMSLHQHQQGQSKLIRPYIRLEPSHKDKRQPFMSATYSVPGEFQACD